LRLEREKLALRRRLRDEEFLKWSVRQEIQSAPRERLDPPLTNADEPKKLTEADHARPKTTSQSLAEPEPALGSECRLR